MTEDEFKAAFRAGRDSVEGVSTWHNQTPSEAWEAHQGD